MGVIDRDEGLDTALGEMEAALDQAVEATPDEALDLRGALSVVEVPTAALPTPSRDWPTALRLVERAAGIIQDYEKKFVAIEQDARTFIQRVNEEQLRYTRCIATLEQQLAEAEKRAAEAEAALKTAKVTIWETRIENRDYQKRLAEAEAELRNSSSYIQKVEDLLGGL
ncbi:hypothetical protein ASG54_10495 [Aureimonas sp. Leaf460]|nr:hypothetical protein ASG62_07895 [Aureimonas sp. Leaf427]KQT79430.1 hypothetical protein ASG54_10495 [Aureimonas sp. Leaf460]